MSRSRWFKWILRMRFETNILYKMNHHDDEEITPSRERCRQTTFGFNSEEHDQIDKIVSELVQVHHLCLGALVTAFQKFPFTRDETKLIQEIFKKPQLVRDMISFLLEPREMRQKYKLSETQTSRFIKNIAAFMKENLQFYQFYFLLLEENTLLVENPAGKPNEREFRRDILDPKAPTLDQWFDFLDQNHEDKNELYASLGYLTEIFIPFIKYEFSLSSRVNDYYETKYKEDQHPILLISHFHPQLVEKIARHTHHQAVFKCLFSLVLASLEEQEWKHSLNILTKLCQSAIAQEATSDQHIQNLYKMVREVSDNISNDKNRTIFAFVSAFINSKIVEAAVKRLQVFLLQDIKDIDPYDIDWIIEINMNFLTQIVKIYYLLLENGIDKNAIKMMELKANVLHIRNHISDMIELVRKIPHASINFSNGESLKKTPLFQYSFFSLINSILECLRDFGESQVEMKLDEYFSQLIELMQSCLGQNRWNSIMHSLFEKMVGMIITTQFFKAKNSSLDKFLDFLIENFTNKKYVFLNSTRMANQGDTRSLYNICCKITISFEKACKRFGISNEYEEWGSFVVNVLQDYDKKFPRASSAYVMESQTIQPQDLRNSMESYDKVEAFTGYIDQAAEMKQSINRIDIIKKWKKDKPQNNKTALKRTTSFEKLQKRKVSEDEVKEINKNPTAPRPRVSIPPQKGYNSVFDLKAQKKLSQSGTWEKGARQECSLEQLSKPPQIGIDRILSLEKYAESSEEQSMKSETKLSQFKIEPEKDKQ